jgi:hypothetical protein
MIRLTFALFEEGKKFRTLSFKNANKPDDQLFVTFSAIMVASGNAMGNSNYYIQHEIRVHSSPVFTIFVDVHVSDANMIPALFGYMKTVVPSLGDNEIHTSLKDSHEAAEKFLLNAKDVMNGRTAMSPFVPRLSELVNIGSVTKGNPDWVEDMAQGFVAKAVALGVLPIEALNWKIEKKVVACCKQGGTNVQLNYKEVIRKYLTEHDVELTVFGIAALISTYDGYSLEKFDVLVAEIFHNDYKKLGAECKELHRMKSAKGGVEGGKARGGRGNPKNHNAKRLYDVKIANKRKVTFTEACESTTDARHYSENLLLHMQSTDFKKCGCWKVFLEMHAKVAALNPTARKNWLNRKKKLSNAQERTVYRRALNIKQKMKKVWEQMDKQRGGLKV